MNEEASLEFSWSGLFIVTASCSFLFNILLKIMDNYFSTALFLIGGIAFFLGILNWFSRMIIIRDNKKNKNHRLIS